MQEQRVMFSRRIAFSSMWAAILIVLVSHLRGEYLWPLEGKIWLNSSFAECRPNHFHAGIDIHARIGTPLRAIDDGYIWHVAVNPFGYGKSIFMRLNDGRTVVYAHLDRYESKIEQVVELEQKRRFSYQVSLYFKEERFPVEKGEIVGYAGTTGAMGAHLHFEIRDTQNRPIDPLTLGYSVQDSAPPAMKGVLLVPLDESSRIGGQPFPILVKPNGGGSSWTIGDTIPFFGCIGIALHCEDYQDEWPFRLNVLRSMLYVNGKEVFRARYDRFSYAHTREVELEFDYGMYDMGIGRFHRLYRYGDNHLLFYEKSDGLIVSEGAPEIQELKMICHDSNGNVSVLIVYLKKEKQPGQSGSYALHSPYLRGEGAFMFRNMVVVILKARGDVTVEKALNAKGIMDIVRCGEYAIGYFRLDPKPNALCSLVFQNGGEEEIVAFPYGWIAQDSAGQLESGDGMFAVRIPSGQLYEDLYVRIRQVTAEIPEQLRLITGPYRIEPFQTIFKKEVEVLFPYSPKASSRIGIYMLKKDGWIYLGNSYDSERRAFTATSRHLGTFALMADTTAPEIVDFVVEEDADQIHKIAFIVKDGAGTGFKMSGIKLTLDGTSYIPALEPFQDEVSFLLFGKTFAKGNHTARISVTDQAGNRNSRAVSF
jgi:hypothetical protein